VIFLIWVISAGVSVPQNGVGLQMGLWAVTDVITGDICGTGQLPARPALAVTIEKVTRQRCAERLRDR
jgi:hypothetical protein